MDMKIKSLGVDIVTQQNGQRGYYAYFEDFEGYGYAVGRDDYLTAVEALLGLVEWLNSEDEETS